MSSLEKKMFFLPNKFYVVRNKLFVSFNLKVIPRDMKVTHTVLHLTLPKPKSSTKVYLKEIKTHWDKESIEKGILPQLSKTRRYFKTTAEQKELAINVTALSMKWLKKNKYNHGIYIKIKNARKNKYYYPYLITDTI